MRTIHILLIVAIVTDGILMRKIPDFEIVEGDIMIPKKDFRNGIRRKSAFWPGGIIPYEIAGEFADYETDFIMKGFENFHQNTCIKFIPKNCTHKNYISIVRYRVGCNSFVGMQNGMQEVHYAKYCLETVGQSVHELMHAVGFEHEHNRFDRDEHIQIYYDNIQDELKFAFDKISEKDYTTYDVPYNYKSVMHYTDEAFAKQPGLKTIKAIKPFDGTIGGNFGDGLTSTDMKKINIMYNCENRKGPLTLKKA